MENEYAPGADTSLFGKKEQCVFNAAASSHAIESPPSDTFAIRPPTVRYGCRERLGREGHCAGRR
jgi:hypothetical protein